MLVRFEVEDGIGTITLNRPDKLNALSNELSCALVETLTRVAADEEVRAVVLTGAGRAFSAGGDVASMQRHHDGYAPHALGACNVKQAGIGIAGACQRHRAVRGQPGPVVYKAGAVSGYRTHCTLLVAAWQQAWPPARACQTHAD